MAFRRIPARRPPSGPKLGGQEGGATPPPAPLSAGTRRGTQDVAAVAFLCCPQCCLDHRTDTLPRRRIHHRCTNHLDRPWAHDQLSSGRMGHLRVQEKLAVTRRNSPDLNRKPTRLRAVASENLTGMLGEADRSWMNELLVGYAPVSTEQQDLTAQAQWSARAWCWCLAASVRAQIVQVTPLRGTRASRVGRRHTPSRRGPPRSPSRP
jgi:hypothetical protein